MKIKCDKKRRKMKNQRILNFNIIEHMYQRLIKSKYLQTLKNILQNLNTKFLEKYATIFFYSPRVIKRICWCTHFLGWKFPVKYTCSFCTKEIFS